MRSLRLPVAPYHSSLIWIGGVMPAVTRLSVTSGVRPTAWAIDPSALRSASKRIVRGACLSPNSPAAGSDPAGRVERGRNVADLETPVAPRGDRHDVEPAVRLADPHPLEVALRQPNQPSALPPRHGGSGPVAPALLPALHLDEDPDLPIAADPVELALTKLHVARDDAQARALQELRRRFFGCTPERVTRIAHATDRERTARG